MASRLETNFNRLLTRCEAMAAEKRHSDWRLEKYVGALEEQLTDLRKSSCKPAQEVMKEYTKKVEFLKGLIEAEKKETASEKAMAAEMLAPSSNPSSHGNVPSICKEIHLQTKSRYQQQMRDELLGKDEDEVTENGLRHRKATSEEDIDAVLKYHHDFQEKLAEEMVHLAKNLKENARVAGRIVQDDTKKLGDSSKIADTNYSKLKTESERLEAHVQKTCNWWIWVMLVIVCMTFIWMVLFMKMFPKR